MPNTPVRAAAEGMPTINRRKMLTGLAVASTAIAVSEAVALESSSTLNVMIEAHRAARLAYTAADDRYGDLFARTELPDAKVVTGVLYQTKEPVRWARSVEEINREARIRQLHANERSQEDWRRNKIAELDEIRDRRRRIYRTSGREKLEEALERASDAEWNAFLAIRDYRPRDIVEAATKAAYLIRMAEGDELERIQEYAVDILKSYAVGVA